MVMNRYQYFGYDEVHERVRLQMRLMDVMNMMKLHVFYSGYGGVLVKHSVVLCYFMMSRKCF